MTNAEIISRHSRKTGYFTFSVQELETISYNTRYGDRIPEWVRRVMRRRGVYVPVELGNAIRKYPARKRCSVSGREG